jgi:hypothetical protein
MEPLLASPTPKGLPPDPPLDPAPLPSPGETVPPAVRRVLDRPPSDRYGGEEPPQRTPIGSLPRAAVFAILAAAVGAAILVEVASPMALSEPLVVVAALLGVATGIATRLGAGTSVPASRRRALALVVALVAVGVADFIVWRIALSEGGVLGFVDYQLEVFGPIAILQPIAAAIGAAATA